MERNLSGGASHTTAVTETPDGPFHTRKGATLAKYLRERWGIKCSEADPGQVRVHWWWAGIRQIRANSPLHRGPSSTAGCWRGFGAAARPRDRPCQARIGLPPGPARPRRRARIGATIAAAAPNSTAVELATSWSAARSTARRWHVTPPPTSTDLEPPPAALDPERTARCDRCAGHHPQTVADGTPRRAPQELGGGQRTIDREQGGDPRCVHAGAIVGYRPSILVDLLEGDVGGLVETVIGHLLQSQRAQLICPAPCFLWQAVGVEEQRPVAADEGQLLDLGGDLLSSTVPTDALGRGRRYLGGRWPGPVRSSRGRPGLPSRMTAGVTHSSTRPR